ncbi:unnamed protein product [Pedinophyceae sp. YPF-701]|nr:unnamed protein product [Pedinophyceae sp. YPF-701]
MREEIVGAFRGIKWTGDSDVDAVRTWRGLSDFWPTEFHPDLTSPRGELVAHRGLTRMVDELSDAVLPALPRDCACAATPVRNGNGNGSGNGGGAARGAVPLALTGHSMGGAMALMLAAELQLLQRVGGNNISAHGFGSPSVIAHAREGPSAALRALGLPAGALRSFVVDNDPIPRAFLQADPVWALVKKFPPARGLLALRDAIGGAGGVMSSTRFLFDPVGELYLLSRDQSDTVRLTSLSHETVEEALDLALGQLQSDPLSALQAVWDHHHHSYAAELAGVAAAVQRRMRAAEGGRS